MKKLKIEPVGVTVRPNAEAANFGECVAMVNMRERNHALEVVGEWRTLTDSIDDESLQLLNLRDDEDVKAVYTVGDFVVVDTAKGYRYYRHKAGSYMLLDFAEIAPQMIIKAVNKTSLTTTVPGITFDEPYSRWNVLAESDRLAMQSAVKGAVGELKSRASRAGAYVQPVAVRYGVRLWDDSLVWVSAPVVVGCGVQMTERISATVADDLSGCGESVLTALAYNVGVMPVKSPGGDWLPLIKAVDVMVSEELNPFADGMVTCRCETSQSGGVVRYLTSALVQKERLVAAASIVNPDKWRVLASITDVEAFFAGVDTRPLLRSGLFTSSVGSDEVRSVTETINHERVAEAGVSVGGRLYSGGGRKVMRHAWQSVQSWGGDVTDRPCEVIVTAHIHTGEGEAVKCDRESHVCTPTAMNALVAYPDARAVSLTIKVLSDDVITEWNGKLVGTDEQGFAYFLNQDFGENAMSPAYSFYMLTEQNIAEDVPSLLTVSRVANPLVTEQRRTVGQGEIVALSGVAKSLYSTVFGRYPVYAFTTDGIFAVSYKEKGDCGDAQRVSCMRMGKSRAMAQADGKVFFVSDRDEVCALVGKDVTVLAELRDVAQLAWVNREKELLVRHYDNSVEVLMLSGRRYGRTAGVSRVSSDVYDAVADDLTGNRVNVSDESDGAVPIAFETYPIAVKVDELIAPMLMTVNASGDFDNVKVELHGSEGVGCESRVLAEIVLDGSCCHPQTTRIYAPPCRLVTLRVDGMARRGSMFRNVVLTYK